MDGNAGLASDGMSAGQGAGLTPGAVWCPFCRETLPDWAADSVTCPACQHNVDLPSARAASQAWQSVAAATANYDELRAQAAELEAKLQTEYARVLNLRDDWHRASLQAQRRSQGAPDAGRPTRPAPALSASVTPSPASGGPAPSLAHPSHATPDTAPSLVHVAHAAHQTPAAAAVPQPRPQVPMAVVLQGTGAVLLLAALVALSAVLWGSLPGWGQVTLLVAAVVLIGALAVVTRKAIPTTSTVLAVLAAAALVVVLVAAPSLLVQWQTTLYPGLAAVIFTAATMVSGQLTRIRLWWLTGVASIPVAALLLVLSLLNSFDLNLAPRWVLAITTALLATVIVALMMWARGTRAADRETSLTAWIAALMSAGLVTMFAVGSLAMLLLVEPVVWWPEKVPWLVVVGSATAVVAAGSRIATDIWPDWRQPLAVVAGALTGGALASLTIVPARWAGAAVAMAVGAVLIAVALRWVRHRWAGHASPADAVPVDVASALFVAAVLGVQFIGVADYRAYVDYGALAGPPELGLDRPWLWLSATLVGVGLGAIAIAEGLWRRLAAFIVGGYVVAAVSWAFGWSWGEVRGTFEVVTVTAGVVALGVLWAARRRGVLTQIPWPAVILVTALPTLVAALGDPGLEQQATWWRVLGVAVATALAALVSVPRWPIVSAVGWAMGLVLPWWAYLAWAAPEIARIPEIVTVPTAVAAASVLAWVIEPRTVSAWWSAVRWPLAAAVAVSIVWSLIDPFDTPGWVAPARVVVLIGASAAVTLRWWERRVLVAVVGSLGILVAWWSVATMLPPISQAVEWQSLPAAAAVAGVMALVVRARGGLARTPLGSGLTIGIPAGLALVPSAIVAVGELAVGDGLTDRFALVVGASAAAVVAGTIRRLGGLLFAGLLALVIAVVPVLLQVVQDLPVWVPLVVVGGTLLAIGARLEHVRRRGTEAVQWLVHLR